MDICCCCFNQNDDVIKEEIVIEDLPNLEIVGNSKPENKSFLSKYGGAIGAVATAAGGTLLAKYAFNDDKAENNNTKETPNSDLKIDGITFKKAIPLPGDTNTRIKLDKVYTTETVYPDYYQFQNGINYFLYGLKKIPPQPPLPPGTKINSLSELQRELNKLSPNDTIELLFNYTDPAFSTLDSIIVKTKVIKA